MFSTVLLSYFFHISLPVKHSFHRCNPHLDHVILRGSFVVICCSRSPGLLSRLISALSLRPASLINSKDTPAITGISTRRSTSLNTLESTWMNIKKKILMIITISRKLVPQRLCNLELFLTFSTVRSIPCSIQLMHLCSAP